MNVEVIVPVLGKEYEFLLDDNTIVSVAVDEIVSVICEKEQCESEIKPGELMLFHMPSRSKLIGNLSLYENGVISGDRLILV